VKVLAFDGGSLQFQGLLSTY